MKKVLLNEMDQIGLITFNNPEKLNPLDFEVLTELNEIMDEVEAKKSVNCIILTGAGDKAFIAGGDIALQNTFTVTSAYEWACLGHSTLRRLELFDGPVIGAVNGYALGGGTEVALVCDILLASEKAVFGQPEVSLGITPGFGGTQRLARKVGSNIAKELILTGRKFSAQEAMELGLVNKVVPHENLIAEAIEMANMILKHSIYAVRYAKTAMDKGIQVDIDSGLEIERALFSLCFDTEEQKAAMTVFVEKRRK